jgi:hypothetical protein
MPFCPSCGKPVERGDLFCFECGHKIRPHAETASDPCRANGAADLPMTAISESRSAPCPQAEARPDGPPGPAPSAAEQEKPPLVAALSGSEEQPGQAADDPLVFRLKKIYTELQSRRRQQPLGFIVPFVVGIFAAFFVPYLIWAIPVMNEMGQDQFKDYVQDNFSLELIWNNPWSVSAFFAVVFLTVVLCVGLPLWLGRHARHTFHKEVAALSQEFAEQVQAQGGPEAFRDAEAVLEQILVLGCRKDRLFLTGRRARKPKLTVIYQEHVIEAAHDGTKTVIFYDGRRVTVMGVFSSQFDVHERGQLAHYKVSGDLSRVWRNNQLVDLCC